MRNVADKICVGQLLHDFDRLVKCKFTDLEFQQFAVCRFTWRILGVCRACMRNENVGEFRTFERNAGGMEMGGSK